MSAGAAVLFWGLFMVVSAEAETIKAESGQSVTLPCRAPNNNKITVEWNRTDPRSEYVLVYRDGRLDPLAPHPSFKNRVDLQDRQMKDGDVSLILKNVTINDEGTYECYVFMRGTNRMNAKPISIIYLRVVVPPGPTGGTTEDGAAGLIVGLCFLLVLLDF